MKKISELVYCQSPVCPTDLDYISGMSKESFKKLVRTKAIELTLRKLLECKAEHSKMTNSYYEDLVMYVFYGRRQNRTKKE